MVNRIILWIVLLGNVTLAKLEVDPGSLLHELLEEAAKASMRAKDLTQQLLTFSKGGSPVLTATTISDVIREIHKTSKGLPPLPSQEAEE